MAAKSSETSPEIRDLLGKELLGDLPIKNNYDLVLLARSGVSRAVAESVISYTGISKKKFVEEVMNLSIKTIERKQPDEKLDQRSSSLVIEVARLLEHAYRIFEDKGKVTRWLSKPNSALHNDTPLELFSTPTGLGMVDDVLTRMEEGIYT